MIADRVRDWLAHAHVTVKPVIDLANQTPVDSYEIPARLTEAVRLRSPVDCFPYATSTSRTGDLDHTTPYRDPDEGGPPGQTRIGNLGPLTRRHHRTKSSIQGLNGWPIEPGRAAPPLRPVHHTGTSRAQPWPTAA